MAHMRLRIPKEYQSGFVKLLNLTEDSNNELLSALSIVPSTYDLEVLSSRLAHSLNTLSAEDAHEVIDILTSLYSLRADMGLPPITDFVESVCDAMNESGNEQLKLSEEALTAFENRLITLFSSPYFDIAVKAISLLYDNQRTFQTVRIITDIRSIFGSDVEDQPKAALIIHMLKVDYIEQKQRKEFFIALDDTDIPALIDALERAQAKAESLKRMLNSTEVSYIGSE
jgi:uncharacterized protein (DUF1778 family)